MSSHIQCHEMNYKINVLLVSFFGPRSSWLGWKKPGFSLAFHLRLWVGSFLDMADLQQLKNAKISIFPHFRAVPAFCDVSTWSEESLPLCWKSESGNFRPIWMIPTPLESSFQSRWRMPHFQTSGKDFSAPKIQFEVQILLNQCNDRSILGKKNGNFACQFQIFESKKNFLAVSGSNCQVLPHQNPTEPWISWRIRRRRKNHLSSLKFKFSPFNLTIHCCTPKMWNQWVTQVS